MKTNGHNDQAKVISAPLMNPMDPTIHGIKHWNLG